jgi:propionyl-CoA synthetase
VRTVFCGPHFPALTSSSDRAYGRRTGGLLCPASTRSIAVHLSSRKNLEQPEEYWAEAAEGIDWVEPWKQVLDDSRAPMYRWFSGAHLNTCYNALDRHVERGRADQAALSYDSPATGTTRSFTYLQLRDEVAKLGGVLLEHGVQRADRVIIYMPMVPEAVMAMLALSRIGAIHSVVFGGFAANELANRIEHAKPKIVITASCGIEVGSIVAYKPLLDAAIEPVHSKPERCIVLQGQMLKADLDPDRDLDWEQVMATATPADCVPVEALDPLHPVHLQDHRSAEGNRTRQRRPCRCARVDDEAHL